MIFEMFLVMSLFSSFAFNRKYALWGGFALPSVGRSQRGGCSNFPIHLKLCQMQIAQSTLIRKLECGDSRLIIDRLPLAHQFLLLYLLDLLHLFAVNRAFTRMDSANLASVFTPGMLSRPDMLPSEYKQCQQVIKFLIENQTMFSMPKANVARSPSPSSIPAVTQSTPIAIESSMDVISSVQAQSAPTKENKKPADDDDRPNTKKTEGKPHFFDHHHRHKRLSHTSSRHSEQREPDISQPYPHPMPLYRRSTTWLPQTHQPMEDVDLEAAKAAAVAIRSGHLLPNESRKVIRLARSKTVPSKRPKYGTDDPLQVVHVNRGSSVRERRPEQVAEM